MCGSIIFEEEITVNNKWLKKGMLITIVGCMAFSMTGCKGEAFFEKVLAKVDTEKKAEETTEVVDEPTVDVAKPELTENLSGSVIYKTGDTAAALKVEAVSSEGGEITYQWYKSRTNTNGGGTIIEGATQNTYTPSTEEEGTFYYYAVATSSIGNSANRITSETVEIIVSNDPEALKAAQEAEKAAEEKPADAAPAEEAPAEEAPADTPADAAPADAPADAAPETQPETEG